MKRAIVFAIVGGALLIASLGVGMATGFHPATAVANMFEDPCDSPTATQTNAANATASDPCGDEDGESNDDG